MDGWMDEMLCFFLPRYVGGDVKCWMGPGAFHLSRGDSPLAGVSDASTRAGRFTTADPACRHRECPKSDWLIRVAEFSTAWGVDFGLRMTFRFCCLLFYLVEGGGRNILRTWRASESFRVLRFACKSRR